MQSLSRTPTEPRAGDGSCHVANGWLELHAGDLTKHFGLRVPALVTVQFFQHTKAAEHLTDEVLTDGGHTLVRNCVNLKPLSEIVHSYQDIVVGKVPRISAPTCSIGAPTSRAVVKHASAMLQRTHIEEHRALHAGNNQESVSPGVQYSKMRK